MSEHHSEHSIQPEGPQVPEAAIEAAIERSTGQLQEYADNTGVWTPRRQEASKHILKVADIVRDNPDRVAADMSKPPQHQTEYDPERAHLFAHTIDKNMTTLARHQRRLDAGKNLLPWQRKAREKHLLGAALGEMLAIQVYNDDPVESAPIMVTVQKERHVQAGHRAYKNIKGSKSTK